jgi:D-glycero-D-manno-heptose 1,7-bisphosphate phosphatase
MLLDAQQQFGFDLKRSFVVGDKAIDIRTGKAVGAVSIQVSTGYGQAEQELCAGLRDHYADDLYDAVQFIKSTLNQ